MRKYRRASLIVLVILAVAATGVWWHWFRADYSWVALQDDPMRRLATVPDLAPQLTKEEVSAASAEWNSLLVKIKSTSEPDDAFLQGTSRAWKLLSSELANATKVTLYSIHPGEGALDDRMKAELAAMPQFQRYPVLGDISLERPEDVKKWNTFLQGQIMSGDRSLCMFEPRHGFRFSTPRGDVDLLMCFACGDMEVDERTKGRLLPKVRAKVPLPKAVGYSPRLTPLIRDVVNALFDKQGIRRHREEKHQVDE
jgi:hypothetical protein